MESLELWFINSGGRVVHCSEGLQTMNLADRQRWMRRMNRPNLQKVVLEGKGEPIQIGIKMKEYVVRLAM